MVIYVLVLVVVENFVVGTWEPKIVQIRDIPNPILKVKSTADKAISPSKQRYGIV